MPELPVGNEVIEAALVNVPVDDTPKTQLLKHPVVGMLVASIVMLLSELQPQNILL